MASQHNTPSSAQSKAPAQFMSMLHVARVGARLRSDNSEGAKDAAGKGRARTTSRGRNKVVATGDDRARRARNITEIMGEANRDSGYCNHVAKKEGLEKPLPPNWLIGSKEAVIERAAAWENQARSRDGKRWKSTSPSLSCIVASFPADADGQNGMTWEQVRDASIEKLLAKYGDRLIGVVEHLDEANPHIHAYLVPLDGESFGAVHPGYAASRERVHTDNRVGTAFRQAMSKWGTEMYESIFKPLGFKRYGPRRQRMSRYVYAEYKAAQEKRAEAEALLKEAQEKAAPAKKVLDDIVALKTELSDLVTVLQTLDKTLLAKDGLAKRAMDAEYSLALRETVLQNVLKKQLHNSAPRSLSLPTFADGLAVWAKQLIETRFQDVLKDIEALNVLAPKKQTKAVQQPLFAAVEGGQVPTGATKPTNPYANHPNYIETGVPLHPQAPKPGQGTGTTKAKKKAGDDE